MSGKIRRKAYKREGVPTVSQHDMVNFTDFSEVATDAGEDDLQLGASASPTTGECLVPEDIVPTPATEYSDYPLLASSHAEATTSDAIVEAPLTYVGLVNQAMTCYLNSLVQALYMTPEFRNAIYNWEFDGLNEARSIPYQLQKLFLNLQTSTKSAVETTDLTTSFGWQGSDAWHQHDIQELCRVMFDALERKFKDTKQANLINDLYEGKMLDYVKCLDCGTEKSREDTFLDIPLPVRPFGSTVAYNSVEEALRAFVQPETLEGTNQYHCDKCNKKCDAHKGLKFMKFPYLLTLHLKRFDFDYNSMHRIKLNDKVVFPEFLNLNSFVPNRTETKGLEEREAVVKCDDCSTTDSGSPLDDESCQGTDSSIAVNDHEDNCEDSDEGIDVSSVNANHEPEAKGPYNYELFSIMIHSGSASGGHYYAYIKDFDKSQWFCFNDQSVNRITEDDIRKTYGGGPQKGYYSGVYTSSTNAYMLMYRQIDKEKNCPAMKVDEFPEHMRNLIQHLKDREKTDRINREKQNNSLRFNVYCCHPVTREMKDIRLNLYFDSTLEEAVAMAHRRFKLDGLADIDDCRLVLYNKRHSCIDFSFESNDLKFCDIADKYSHFYSDWLLLEIKEPGAEFETFKKGGIDMKVYHVNIETEDVREPVSVRVDKTDTVSDLKRKLASLLFVDVTSIKVVITKLGGTPQYLNEDEVEVPFEDPGIDYKLYVSNALDEDPDKPFEDGALFALIEKFADIQHLVVLLPDTEPATLDRLCIPSLDTIQSCDSNSPSLRVSPQPNGGPTGTVDGFSDQSNSEDSSLSDSDRTLVGDAPGEGQGLFSSDSASPADQHMPSPAEDVYNYDVLGNSAEEMHWENTTAASTLPVVIQDTYFRVTSVKECERNRAELVDCAKVCKVFIEKHATLDQFKKYLQPIVRVPREYFKIYTHLQCADEEWTNLSDTFRRSHDGKVLTVKLGRALSLNEYICQVYLFKMDKPDTNNFLFEHIFSKGQLVGDLKKQILWKAKKQQMLDLSFNKCRLREKCQKQPKRVYLNEQVFGDDIYVSSHEMYLQELPDVEKVTSVSQLALFARHWCPSTLTLQPFQEVILDDGTMAELKTKVADLSNIPLEHVEVAFLRSPFLCDIHLLDINALEWDLTATDLTQWPLHLESGAAFYYRDGREQLKELTAEEKKEISIKENARLGRIPAKSSSNFEKSLKIYSDNWPSENEDNCID